MDEELVDISWDVDEMYPCLEIYDEEKMADYYGMIRAKVPKNLLERFKKAESEYVSVHAELLALVESQVEE